PWTRPGAGRCSSRWLPRAQNSTTVRICQGGSPGPCEDSPPMTRYVLKRLVLLPALLFLFSVAVFAIVQAPPGDFLTTYVATLASSGSSISAEQVEALRREYGLDRPVWVQYLKWMENLAKGN